MEMLLVFTSIGMDNFESEIWLELRPVLLACIHRRFEAKEQLKILEEVSRKIDWNVKICLSYKGHSDSYQVLSVEGTPTFLLFADGEEIGRVLGKVSPEALIKFVSEKLAQKVSDPEQISFPPLP
jgi:thioredoxin-related protein